MAKKKITKKLLKNWPKKMAKKKLQKKIGQKKWPKKNCIKISKNSMAKKNGHIKMANYMRNYKCLHFAPK